MKKLILMVAFIATSLTTFAQVDVKINPLSLIFGRIGASGEFIVSDNFGAEAGAFINVDKETLFEGTPDQEEFSSTGAGILLSGKYYFSPEDGGDKFFAGLYTRYKSNSYKSSLDNSNYGRSKVAIGMLVGTKWVSKNNIVFELGLGLGRNVASSVSGSDPTLVAAAEAFNTIKTDFLTRISVGYRFGAN